MDEIEIKRDDVLKQMYFILSIVQNTKTPMHSRVTSKNDYMGGIIDRFVNSAVESLIFTKLIFPKIKTKKKLDLIRDFYSYDPGTATIAPDLFGIIVDGKPIPFITYNDGWNPVESCPQVEIKSFKRKQKMLSLVNQHYDRNNKEYLILAESNYKVDYLMPFMSTQLFNDELYDEIVKDVQSFNKEILNSDTNENIKLLKKVDFSDDSLGSLNVIRITTAKNFMKIANLAKKGVTPECIKNIELVSTLKKEATPISNYCDEMEKNYYRFNESWYNLTDDKGKIYRKNLITLDFYCSDIKYVELVKMNKSNFYIRITQKTSINYKLFEPGDYKVDLFSGFARTSINNDEYFMDKALYQRITNCENDLLEDIKKIIETNQ